MRGRARGEYARSYGVKEAMVVRRRKHEEDARAKKGGVVRCARDDDAQLLIGP